MVDRWLHGQMITRREVLGFSPLGEVYDAPWSGSAWLEVPVRVVDDRDEQLVTYLATGAELRFPAGDWPTPDGRHPWQDRVRWQGHGCLMVHDLRENHAIWHFWSGPERDFRCWYLNLQTALRRVPDGFESQDLEADLLVFPDGSWQLKDMDLLDQRETEGRYSPELVTWIRRYATELAERVQRGDRWWDESWATWTPPEGWDDPVAPSAPHLGDG